MKKNPFIAHSIATTIILFIPAVCLGYIASPSGPTSSEDGNYTITYPWDQRDAGCEWVELQERSPGSDSWSYVQDSNYDGVVEIVGQTLGVYEYRSLAECEDYYGEYSWEETSGSISVQVGQTPTIDGLQIQLAYEYEARVGDINGDGRQDIYVDRQTVADTGNGSIEELILQQESGGSFTASNPTPSQRADAAAWSVSDVYVQILDVNLDGFVDLFIRDLDEIIPGALSQIVFAPGELYVTDPMGVKAIDAPTTQFLSELRDWVDDPYYFYDNAVEITVPAHWEWEYECNLINISINWQDWDCSWERYWVEEEEYWSYDHFNQDALALANEFGGTVFDATLDSLSPKAAKVVDIFKRIFGVGVFGGVLGTGGIGGWEIEIGLGNDDRGFALVLQLYEVSEEVVVSDWRPLTLNEMMFMDLNGFVTPHIEKVRIYSTAYGPIAWHPLGKKQVIAPNGNIYIPSGNRSFNQPWLWSQDYSLEQAWSKMTFIHEAFHVYEYHAGKVKLGGITMLIKRLANPNYAYSIEPGKDFWDYGLEERATMIMDRWYLGNTGSVSHYGQGVATMSELNSVIPFTCYVCP